MQGRSPLRVAVVVGAVLFSGSAARGEGPKMPQPFEAVGDDTLASFSGTNLLYHAFAVGSLAVLSPTLADHEARVWVQESIHAPFWGEAAYYGGYLVPTLIGPALYVAGLSSRERSLAGAGSAAILALGLTLSTTVVLKVATGRPFPLHGRAPDAPDRLDYPEYSREFSPFGFAGRYAWPSGHTSASVSVAAALSAYSKGAIWVPLTAYPIALGISTGMLVGDDHWLSDVLSGAALGQAIGWTVGSNFRAREQCRASPRQAERCAEAAHGALAAWTIVPLTGEAHGLAVVGVLR